MMNLMAPELGVLESISRSELKEMLHKALGNLKPRERKAIELWMNGMSIRAIANELNTTVGAVKPGNIREKVVYVAVNDLIGGHLAAACDRIVMPPSGMLSVTGVRMEMTYYKGLLDKLGVQFEPVFRQYLPGFSLQREAMLMGVGFMVGLGLVAGAVPAAQAMQLRIVEALRRE